MDQERDVDEGMWTAKEAAAYLKVSTRWVYEFAAKGLVPHRQIPGRQRGVRFVPAEIRAFARGEWKPSEAA